MEERRGAAHHHAHGTEVTPDRYNSTARYETFSDRCDTDNMVLRAR